MPPISQAAKTSRSTIKKRLGNKPRADDLGEDLEEWKRARQLVKPKDQVELSEAELKEIIAKALTTANPQQPDNVVEFNYAQRAFAPVPPAPNTVVVYESQGTAILKDSEEAEYQMRELGIEPEPIASEETLVEDTHFEDFQPTTTSEKVETETVEDEEKGEEETEEQETVEAEKKVEEEEADAEGDAEGEGEGDAEVTVKTVKKEKGKRQKLTNQFNFSERAALTYNNPTRVQETQTIPPPMATFSAQVLQWVIYDAYQKDYEQQQLEKELEREKKEKEKAPISKHTAVGSKKSTKGQLGEEVQARVLESWKVLERMINQNTYRDIAQDYRYWDDPSDEYRGEEGTLLPLWKFTHDKAKKNTVTDLNWNPNYYDLFVVCFGFLEFMKPVPEGAVCLFTLKNPSYPDYICMTNSAVMCVDIHPKNPYMLVIGLYNGTVQVFNIQASCKIPAYTSNNVNDKHRGIVWEVKWAPNLPDGEMNFYSGGADGKIINWVLMQVELSATTIITLFLDKESVAGPDGTQLKVKGAASCIKLHPTNDQIYLVGTEEGLIYKCSVAYSSMYLLTYQAHQMPVHRIDFNRYNTDIFISCSGDWRIKVWEDNRIEPLFVFDVGDCVGDVKWAPYSSTVFAAVTNEGKVYVFDLNVNKYKPIAVQAIVSKKRNKLSRIAFNPKMPIIIVGDDKGCVTSLKLSPNLRIPCKPPKKQQNLDQWTLQCMKLDKLLSLVREPVTLDLPEDTAASDDS